MINCGIKFNRFQIVFGNLRSKNLIEIYMISNKITQSKLIGPDYLPVSTTFNGNYISLENLKYNCSLNSANDNVLLVMKFFNFKSQTIFHNYVICDHVLNFLNSNWYMF